MIHPSKILNEKGLHALKSFGQNFLVSQSTLEGFDKILDKKHTICEIGPGLGAVTLYFIEKGFKVVAVEKDKKLAAYLQEELNQKAVIECNDFLKLDSDFFKKHDVAQVVGNLPFYITTDIIVKIIKELPFVNKAILGVQKEFAERLTKVSGNSFAVFVHSAGDLKKYRSISKNNFYPIPDVDATWLIWERNQKVEDLDHFELFLRGLFWAKRKSLGNTLTKNPFFSKNDLSKSWIEKVNRLPEKTKLKRGDALSFNEILDLYQEVTKN